MGEGDRREQAKGRARNRRDRLSTAIKKRDAENVSEAAAFARAIGLPLNSLKTVHWSAAGVTDGGMATVAFKKKAGDWLRARGVPLACAWVHEVDGRDGFHLHMLLHMPPALAQGFGHMQRRWLRQISGRPYRRRVIQSVSVGGALPLALATDAGACALYEANLANVLDYVLKGSDEAARAALGLGRQQAGGAIMGKRCGVSANLDRAARQRAGWVARRGGS